MECKAYILLWKIYEKNKDKRRNSEEFISIKLRKEVKMKINKQAVNKKLQELFNEKFCEDFEKYFENEEGKIEKESKEKESKK